MSSSSFHLLISTLLVTFPAQFCVIFFVVVVDIEQTWDWRLIVSLRVLSSSALHSSWNFVFWNYMMLVGVPQVRDWSDEIRCRQKIIRRASFDCGVVSRQSWRSCVVARLIEDTCWNETDEMDIKWRFRRSYAWSKNSLRVYPVANTNCNSSTD